MMRFGTMVWRRTVAALAAALPLLVLAAGTLQAQSLQNIFSRGNEAYFQGDYAGAVAQYRKLADAGVDDADVYYNLAAAHARNGELGRAVLYLERAIRINPRDEAAEAALSTCRSALGHNRAEKEGEATVQTRPPLSKALVRPFSENQLAWMVAVFDLAFFGVLVALRIVRRESRRIALGVAAPLLGLLLLAAGAGLAVKSEVLENGRAAIVLLERAELREGPDPRAQVRATAREGQPARILAREGAYLRVRLGGGAEGWMKQKAVEEI
jgi:tetratricopeptide (TPR) repeat protein